MKYIVIIVILIFMMNIVSALEPSLEVDCCYDLRIEPNNNCKIIENVTKESCITIIDKWGSFMQEFNLQRAQMEEMIGPCCVEVMRDAQVNEKCNILELDKKICEPIASKYLSQNKGIPLLSDITLRIIGFLVLAGIFLLFWRKSIKN